MSAVNITAVDVLDNPAPFTNPLALEIQYECLQRLDGDLEFKLIYVGSAEDETKDQVLDEVLLGPVEAGSYRFVFQADAPDPTLIPKEDIVGVTVVLLTCSYQEQELIRVGYYVANEYEDEELKENPPEQPIIDKLRRTVIADKPRVTRFHVDFDLPEGSVQLDEDPSGPMDNDAAEPLEVGTFSNENAPDPNVVIPEGATCFSAIFQQQQQQAQALQACCDVGNAVSEDGHLVAEAMVE